MIKMGEIDKNVDPLGQVLWLQREINGEPGRDSQDHVELDPRIVKAGFDLTGYYIQTGLRSFPEYAQKMVEEYGEDVRPYLRSWYLSVRYYPGVDPSGMDSAAQVNDFVSSEW